MTGRRTALHPNLTPRGLSREEAAAYVGIGATLFDRLIADGLMPKPKMLAGRKVWDIRALDRAFDALPGEMERNPWEDVAA
jgi:predicted DNA-binding transcriptional regulator AlpA